MPIPAVIAAANKARKAVDAATGGKATAGGKKVLRWAVGGTAGLVVLLTLSVGGPLPSEAGTCGPGALVPSSADLPAPTLAAINALKPDYEAAAAANDIGWGAVAALDYREDANSPDRSALSGEVIGTANPDSGVVTSSKADSLDQAAKHLKAMASSVYGVTITASSPSSDMALAFLAYNRGSIYSRTSPPTPPEMSPYVYNQADSAHTDMAWPSIPGEPLAGQREVGRFGAVVVFLRLGGPAGACGGLSDVDIVRIAEGEIGNAESPAGSNDGPAIAKYRGSDPPEAWCADWVSWVYREAGHTFAGGAEGWRIANVSVLHQWLIDHGVWVDANPTDLPHPGDVVTFRDDEHTGIVEKVDGLTVVTVEGNTSDMVARRTYPAEGGAVNSQIVGWGRQAAA